MHPDPASRLPVCTKVEAAEGDHMHPDSTIRGSEQCPDPMIIPSKVMPTQFANAVEDVVAARTTTQHHSSHEVRRVDK